MRLFDLPDRHPDRIIAAQIVLYVGLAIVIAATLWNHWKAAQHTLAVAASPTLFFAQISSHQRRQRDCASLPELLERHWLCRSAGNARSSTSLRVVTSSTRLARIIHKGIS